MAHLKSFALKSHCKSNVDDIRDLKAFTFIKRKGLRQHYTFKEHRPNKILHIR